MWHRRQTPITPAVKPSLAAKPSPAVLTCLSVPPLSSDKCESLLYSQSNAPLPQRWGTDDGRACPVSFGRGGHPIRNLQSAICWGAPCPPVDMGRPSKLRTADCGLGVRHVRRTRGTPAHHQSPTAEAMGHLIASRAKTRTCLRKAEELRGR